MANKIGKPRQKKPGPAEVFPPPGLPPLKDLLDAVDKVDPSLLTAVTMLKAWEVFGKADRKSIKFIWKKLVPKLGAAIRQMLSGVNLPPILQAIVTKSADLTDRDVLVQRLEGALANANTLVLLLGGLLMYHKAEYYKETTGLVTDLRGLIVNKLFDADQRHEVEKQAKLVLQVGDEITQEPLDTKKTNKAIRDQARKDALAAQHNPELDAKDLELRVVRGGSITAQDLTQDAAPKGAQRRTDTSTSTQTDTTNRRGPAR